MRIAERLGSLVLLLALAGCRERLAQADVRHEAAEVSPTSTEVKPAPALPPPPPAVVEPLDVPEDRAASVVRGPNGLPPRIVFVGGVCSNATAYLFTFPEAARSHGGALAIEGDQPCGADPRYRTYSWDADRLHARITRAVTAAGVDLAQQPLTLAGYSQGATLAEQLTARWPDRYRRVVLIGSPTDPAPRSFLRTEALVTMSCSLDVPDRMRKAAARTAVGGTPATFLSMPGCRHGNVAAAESTFGEAFDWLESHAIHRDTGE